MKIAILLLALGLPTLVSAQTTISVDIGKAQLQWDWAVGAGGPVEKFNVKCGPTATSVTKVTVVTDPNVRSIPVQQAITGSDNWFCAINAENSFGVSADSNQVPFAAGVAPLAPSSLRLLAK